MSEPYFKWDPRPHGWFTANGLTKFGPLPKRERSDETWPPPHMERAQHNAHRARMQTPVVLRAAEAEAERLATTMEEARQHFAPLIAEAKK